MSPSRSREGLGEGMLTPRCYMNKPSPDPSRKREGRGACPLLPVFS